MVPSLRVRPAATRCHCVVPCGRCCRKTRWSATGAPAAVSKVPVTPTRWLNGTRTRPGFSVMVAGGGLLDALDDGAGCGADDAGAWAGAAALAVGAGLLCGSAAAGAAVVVRPATVGAVAPTAGCAVGNKGRRLRGRDAPVGANPADTCGCGSGDSAAGTPTGPSRECIAD